MEVVNILLFFFIAGTMLALVLFNRYRISRLLHYLHRSRGRELSERDFRDLLERYTSWLGHAQGFPSKKQYASLYTNAEYRQFYSRATRLLTYLLLALAFGLTAETLIDYFLA